MVKHNNSKTISDKPKVKLWIIGIIVVVIIVAILLILRGPEDSWIKDSRGVWIKHGNPAVNPQEVLDQQEGIRLTAEIYYANNARKVNFSSQCLGLVHLKNGVDYAVDIVSVPRTANDDLIENQCSENVLNQAEYFIELDKTGEIVRIV